MITVTYLDHSGFALTTPGAVMIFDYYKDPDHFNTSIFELAQDRKRTYILANDIFSKFVPKTGLSVAWMSAGDVIDSIPGTTQVKAYGSTDTGVSYAITLTDGSVIFHAGDLNDWHWSEESTEREVAKAEERFKVIVDRIAEEIPEIKIAMFPVDARMGTDFAKGAQIFLSKVKVDNFFPMHFWGEPQKACDFNAYVPAATATRCYCLDRPGMNVEIKG